MERAEALDVAEAALHRAGYEASRRCAARMSCFDFAARKEERLIFIKVFPDIRDVLRSDALGIETISRCFSCTSLFISDMKGKETLRDDTVYSRYGIYVVTSKTFDDIIRGAFPLVEAAPGVYCVRMNGGKIRERRHELGLSIGKLAEMVGISRRTLYGYEKDMTRASVSAAYRLEEILGVPLVKTIDIFEAPPRGSDPEGSSDGNCVNAKNRFLQFILSKLAQFDLKVAPMQKAPFDFTANCPDTKLKIIGGHLRKRERQVKERIEEILSLSRIVEARPLLVGREKVADNKGVAFLSYGELARIRDRKELAELL